jgi:hypothetical protein
MKSVFTEIYKKNKWKNKESRSGFGSTIEYTKEVRKHLPLLIKQFNIKSVLDAPCGDFNWMSKIVDTIDASYIGGDIVEILIETNKKNYPHINFITLDITEDTLPTVDLMMCRDCLFHFSYKSINLFFDNFLKSDIKYLLTSTHINNPKKFKNRNITDGKFRLIDLYAAPFNFNKVSYKFNDWIEPSFPREMILLSRDEIKEYANRI